MAAPDKQNQSKRTYDCMWAKRRIPVNCTLVWFCHNSEAEELRDGHRAALNAVSVWGTVFASWDRRFQSQKHFDCDTGLLRTRRETKAWVTQLQQVFELTSKASEEWILLASFSKYVKRLFGLPVCESKLSIFPPSFIGIEGVWNAFFWGVTDRSSRHESGKAPGD